jgi:hypothetical protein
LRRQSVCREPLEAASRLGRDLIREAPAKRRFVESRAFISDRCGGLLQAVDIVGTRLFRIDQLHRGNLIAFDGEVLLADDDRSAPPVIDRLGVITARGRAAPGEQDEGRAQDECA